MSVLHAANGHALRCNTMTFIFCNLEVSPRLSSPSKKPVRSSRESVRSVNPCRIRGRSLHSRQYVRACSSPSISQKQHYSLLLEFLEDSLLKVVACTPSEKKSFGKRTLVECPEDVHVVRETI